MKNVKVTNQASALAALKNRSGLTWTALAASLGVTYNHLACVRRGERNLSKPLRLLVERMLAEPRP